MQKNQVITDLNVPNDSRDIPFQSQEFEQDGCCHFSASFSLKYDVTDAILQGNENMSLLCDLFETLQAVRA